MEWPAQPSWRAISLGSISLVALPHAVRPYRRPPPSEKEQARRVAWGKMAGAKVAAAYKQLTEGK